MKAIEALLLEGRRFAPPAPFTARAVAADPEVYARAERDPEGFWAAAASELHWFRRWDRVLDWNLPYAQWFVGGTTNLAYNCLDRQLELGRGGKTAYIWEGEPGDTRTMTYAELHRDVCRFANVLKSLGVRRGDRVAIYLPMIPELPIAMLACARIGAAHTVIFGGFSAESLSGRINDAQAKVLITADGGWRRGAVVPLKRSADEAMAASPSVEHAVIVRRVGDRSPVQWQHGRDHWWHDLMAAAAPDCPAEELDSEELLYILYTSGTTG